MKQHKLIIFIGNGYSDEWQQEAGKRGLLNLKNGQNKNAIADFDAALKINPRLTSSLYGRGLAKKRNGSISEGDLDINNAKAMDPNIVKEFADYGVQ